MQNTAIYRNGDRSIVARVSPSPYRSAMPAMHPKPCACTGNAVTAIATMAVAFAAGFVTVLALMSIFA